MSEEMISIKRSDFELLLKTIDRQTTSFFLARKTSIKEPIKSCHDMASNLAAFEVRDAIWQVTRSFCDLAGIDFPIPTVLKGQSFMKSDLSPTREQDQS